MPMRPRHTLTVQLREQVKGSAGQVELEDVGDPIPVRGTFHPLGTSERLEYGVQTEESGTWFCTSWPGDIYSRISFRGSTWDQDGPAQTFDVGLASRHVEVILRRRGSHG